MQVTKKRVRFEKTKKYALECQKDNKPHGNKIIGHHERGDEK